ncbi:penicillin-binding protein 2 [bacterium]|nr:penicillin-binding protein 2 [bacterium]MBR2274010.1 penicillin-binding protein 2 [Alphaproteobacteria bacterium]
MVKLGLSKKKKTFTYLPGQEIYFSSSSFGWETEDEAVNVCHNRILCVIGLFIFIYIVIIARIFNVCLVNGIQFNQESISYYRPRLRGMSPVKRANITDRNGVIVATNLPTVNLITYPYKISNPQEIAQKLSEVFPDTSYEAFLKILTRRSKFAYLRRNMTPQQQAKVNALGFPELEFEPSEIRVYPQKELLSHVLGNTDIDNEGIAGLEKSLNNRLNNSTKDLRLTIDLGVQYAVRDELIKAKEKFKAERVTAIVMDINTSEIIALASVPDYDLNKRDFTDPDIKFNFATLGVYEAGSVFKVFNTAMGLDSGKIKITDSFDATKPLKMGWHKITDYRVPAKWLTVGETLIYSSNIASALMALRVGKKLQIKFFKNMGFFDKIENLEIYEKGRPLHRSERSWQDDTVATAAYGYGISVTPIHIITAFSAVLNGGLYTPPTLTQENTFRKTRRVISKQTSMDMRKLLRDVVIYGSGKNANVPGYDVAGKTGSANKLDKNGRYIQGQNITSFVSAFPITDPKYSVMVVMDYPKPLKETYGFVTSGWNSVPTGGKIISRIAPQLNVRPNFDVDTQREKILKNYGL